MYDSIDMSGIAAGASNVKGGQNPPFTIDDFLTFYPQFRLAELPSVVINEYIKAADAAVKQSRWRSQWKMGMSLYVAHYCTLYLKTAVSAGAQAVYSAGMPQGLVTSKSVGDVSQGVDYSSTGDDLKGWAQFKLTVYGQQFASMAKLYGIGGMAVW